MNDIEYLRKYLKDKDLDTALKELESGIPVQYIVGYTNFYGYDFKVNKNTLIPRFETELLVEKTYNYIKKYFNKDNIKILDIGTGSGCIAITLNKLLNSSDITGIDISSEALAKVIFFLMFLISMTLLLVIRLILVMVILRLWILLRIMNHIWHYMLKIMDYTFMIRLLKKVVSI